MMLCSGPNGNVVMFSAVSGGTYLGFATLDTAKKVLLNQTAKFVSGDITLAFS